MSIEDNYRRLWENSLPAPPPNRLRPHYLGYAVQGNGKPRLTPEVVHKLYYEKGLSVAKFAAEVGLGVTTVDKYLYRVRRERVKNLTEAEHATLLAKVVEGGYAYRDAPVVSIWAAIIDDLDITGVLAKQLYWAAKRLRGCNVD